MRIFLEGRDLKDIVIIDNKSDNYISHVHNGIPIREYNGEEEDSTLPDLRDYLLEQLLHAEDVRELIKEDFFFSS